MYLGESSVLQNAFRKSAFWIDNLSSGEGWWLSTFLTLIAFKYLAGVGGSVNVCERVSQVKEY